MELEFFVVPHMLFSRARVSKDLIDWIKGNRIDLTFKYSFHPPSRVFHLSDSTRVRSGPSSSVISTISASLRSRLPRQISEKVSKERGRGT